jgi:pentatricopeptide repeat protein
MGRARLLYRFEDYVLDSDRRELRRGPALLAVEPQVFDLLEFLLRNCDRIVSKEDLLDSVWGGRIVSESTLDSRISAARRIIGDSGKEQRLIRTTIRRGIRFVGTAGQEPSTSESTVADFLPRLSIAVVPFANLSNDPEQEYFADGMVQEIITALSRIRWLFVIGRNSSFTYKGQAIDVKQVGRELGVRYVLEGSVRKAGDRVRITAQLIEAETGAHLWADRFDGSLEDVFDLQDNIASSVAGVIEPALRAAETARSARRPPHDLTAYDLYLRAAAMMLSPARRVAELAELLDRALDRDPDFGPALALAASFHWNSDIFDWCADREYNRRMALERGRRALQVAGDDPDVLSRAACALAYFGEDIDAMIALVDRALTLNPNYAMGWHQSAVLRLWAGQSDIAIEHVERSLRLSPRTRVSWGLNIISAAHFARRRFEKAISTALLAIHEDPTPVPYRTLIASYAHMGRLEEAREAVKQLRLISPEVVPSRLSRVARNSVNHELYMSGLRKAMGETP